MFLSSPLGGEEAVEVCAAGVSWYVLHGENVSQNVVALTAGFVLAHQLGFEKGGPTPLQSLHPSYIRLKETQAVSYGAGNRLMNQCVSQDAGLPCTLVPPWGL